MVLLKYKYELGAVFCSQPRGPNIRALLSARSKTALPDASGAFLFVKGVQSQVRRVQENKRRTAFRVRALDAHNAIASMMLI